MSQLLFTWLPDSDAQLHKVAELGEFDEVQRLLHVVGQNDGNAEFMLGAGHELYSARVRQAAAEGDMQTVCELLQDHDVVPLDATDADGATALHLAASNGHSEVCKWLLERGIRPTSVDRFGGTPLDDALREGNVDIAQMIRTALSL